MAVTGVENVPRMLSETEAPKDPNEDERSAESQEPTSLEEAGPAREPWLRRVWWRMVAWVRAVQVGEVRSICASVREEWAQAKRGMARARQGWSEFYEDLNGESRWTLPKLAARVTFLTLLCVSAVFGALFGLTLVYAVNLPQIDDLVRYRPNTTTELYDIHGKAFGSFALERRVSVPYSEFPPVLREAILSIEDKSFERNSGVNLFRAAEAAYRDMHSESRAQGASTLTMQLARNLFLSAQKSYSRKLQEILLTVQIERRFTKEQIFELYANQIYLGHGTYGFEAGAEFYFSKHVRNLTLPEAALLAALPKGPESYSPIKYPQRAIRRRNLVIEEMLQDGKITRDQAETAKAEPLGLNIEPPPNGRSTVFCGRGAQAAGKGVWHRRRCTARG